MFSRVLLAELLKIRRKWIVALAIIGPLGVVLLQAVNYGLRYDYLMEQYAGDPWEGLLGQVFWLKMPALFIGLALVASMSAGVEHSAGGWKQLLALPVTRLQVFAGKVAVTLLLLLFSCTLLLVFTFVFGLALGLEVSSTPWAELFKQSYLAYLALLPFIALQSWLSLTMSNQAVPMTVGVLGMVLSLFSIALPDWTPWGWAYQVVEPGMGLTIAGAGTATGLLVILIGYAHFARKDVS
ncbi:hypothetical protein SAMN05444162_1903 [Paenibacillaceae bacterium GAS479]|nr:hypothetical protein SAMN05444162_1903 [Paenibacillaceae bacterium GAS479]